MQKAKITSTNSEHLTNLITFAGELFELCRKLESKPIVYGSLAYTYHTSDSSVAINDIDLLVPETIFPKLVELLDQSPEFTYELTTYHSLKVFKNDLKISFDGIEHYLAGLDHDSLEVEINGTPFSLVSKEILKEVYKRGVENIPTKAEAYAQKLATLEA